ncbi:MAG: hypothetical protein ACRDOI_18765 [Trebonia sp.]
MYQQYPGGDRPPEQGPTPADAPQSVARAVRFMYLGAAASLIGIIVDMTTLSATKTAIINSSPTLTPTQVNNAEHVAIGIFIAGGLIGAALWVWMAQSSRAGKGWARIVSTVLFGIDTISLLASIGGASTASGGGPTRIYGIVVWLIGLAAIILLWQRASTDYFRRAPRY